MTLDGLQKILADKYKRRTIKNKQYYPKVNLVRYADDFIITSENREVLEREIKPLVTEFLAERGLTLSDEKTVITNIREGFDFLGFNIRKFKKQLLTKPSRKAQKRFLEKVRTTIKSNKACKQMSLIRLLNPIITGWGNYYRYGASTDAFHHADFQIYKALRQWAIRRHPKKGKTWIAEKYWHDVRGKSWQFAVFFKKADGERHNLTLKRLSDIHFTEYCQIKGDANPFDTEYKQYFDKRETQRMLETLKGRKSLLYLWNKQNRECPICGKPIDRTLSWNVTEKVTDGKIQRHLVHNSCYKRNKRQENQKL